MPHAVYLIFSVAAVVVIPASTTLISLTESVQLTAAARGADGQVISGKSFSWSSSDTDIATVSAQGQAPAVANGSATITATMDGVDGTAVVSVSQVGAQLGIVADPGAVTAGDPFTMEVGILDAAGYIATNAADAVTVAIGSNPSGGRLAGTTTVDAVAGVAQFDDLSIDQTGMGYTLTASAPGLVSATSGMFDVADATLLNATRTLLTDDPFPYDRIERVDLYFVSVSGSLTPDTSAGASFVTLAEPNRLINLLALQNGITDELGAVVLPRGVITAVRVVIDTDSSSITLKDGRVLDGTSTPGIAWQSSAGRPVLNALIHEQIAVPDTGGVVAIIYDVGQAFIPNQVMDSTSIDSGFVFSPVLRAADARRTGSISGTVVADSTSGTPVPDASLRLYLGDPGDPENTWHTLATARSDANGAFRFSYVTPSAWWSQFPSRAGDTYIVAADPPSGTGLGRVLVPSVHVSVGTETPIGTLVLP